MLVGPLGIRPLEGEIFDFLATTVRTHVAATVSKVDAPEFAEIYGGGMTPEQFELFEDARAETARIGWEPFMFNPSLPHHLKGIGQLPVLLVLGHRRPVAPKGLIDAYDQAVPNSKVSPCGVGHRPEIEDPEGFLSPSRSTWASEREDHLAMHVAYFTERPYRGLNEDDLLKNHAYFALPNSHFDHIAGSALYNEYLDEYVFAEDLGFDGLALNEHHGNPFCMGTVMNVEAAILARVTNRARIVLIGNPLPVIKHPLRMAEELATIDLHLQGPPGHRLGARRRQRAVLQQRQPRLQPRDVQRGARLHRAGLDPSRPVALRGQALPLPPREPVGRCPTRSRIRR